MICIEVISDFLADYVDGRLPAATLADFERHIAGCDSCTAYLQNYRATIDVAAAAHRDALPADVPQQLVDAIVAALKIDAR